VPFLIQPVQLTTETPAPAVEFSIQRRTVIFPNLRAYEWMIHKFCPQLCVRGHVISQRTRNHSAQEESTGSPQERVTNKYLQATSETKRSAQDKLVGAILPTGLLSQSKTTLIQ
jgi:hypothetical protein